MGKFAVDQFTTNLRCKPGQNAQGKNRLFSAVRRLSGPKAAEMGQASDPGRANSV